MAEVTTVGATRPAVPHTVPLSEALRVWGRVALLSFGGPAGLPGAGCGVVVVGVVGVVGVVEVAGVVDVFVVVCGTAHDSETEVTGPVTGRLSAETGVPGGTSTVKTTGGPLCTLTVTVHCWAEADGSETSAVPPAATAAMHTTARRLRVLSTIGSLLRPSDVSVRDVRHPAAA